MSLADHPAAAVAKLLTTEKERKSKWSSFVSVSNWKRSCSIVITIVVCMILPSTAPLVGMLDA